MTVLLTLLLIGSILSLDLLILITVKYIISMTNSIKNLGDNSEDEYENILQSYTSKPNVVRLKSKVEGSNVIYFNSFCRVK